MALSGPRIDVVVVALSVAFGIAIHLAPWHWAAGLGLAATACAGAFAWRGRWQVWPLAVAIALLTLLLVLWRPASWPLVLDTAYVAVLLVCSAMLWAAPIPVLPAPSGRDVVGLRIAEVGLPAVAGGPFRRLQLYVWYPAQSEPGRCPRPYHSPLEARACSGAHRALGGPTFLNRHFMLARTATFEAVPVRAGSHPLVIFNHGGALHPTQSVTLMQELASRGFVVIAIGRPGESAGIAWRDGRVEDFEPGRMPVVLRNPDALRAQADYMLSRDAEQQRGNLPALRRHFEDSLGAAVDRWAADSLAVVELFESEPPQELADVAACIDRSRRAYVGMSLGGAVAAECCFLDRRAAAGINLDGINWCFRRLDADVPTPFLQCYADPGAIAPALRKHASDHSAAGFGELGPSITLYNDPFYEAPARAGQRSDVVRVVFRDSGHMAFTDLPLGFRGPLGTALGLGSNASPAVTARANELCAEFLEHYVMGKSGEQLNSLLEGSPALVRQRLSQRPRAAHDR